MENTEQELFYIDLKKRREAQEINISEISERTKINPKYFIEFEQGNFETLPIVYTRLFLRSYAIEIGADPLKVLDDYEIYTTGKIQPKNEFKLSSIINKDEGIKPPKNIETLFPQDNLFKDLNLDLKKILGIVFTLFIIIFLFSKLRNLTAEITSEEKIKNKLETTQNTKDFNNSNKTKNYKSNLPGSYLDGFSLLDRKTIITGINPPYNLKIVSKNHSTIKIKTIENGITTLDKEFDLKPAKPLERGSKDELHFELKNINGISITLNESDKIISQFLKPENISNDDLAIRVIIEKDGSLTTEYFQTN